MGPRVGAGLGSGLVEVVGHGRQLKRFGGWPG